MNRFLRTLWTSLGLAWLPCTAAVTAGLVPVLVIFYVQGRSLVERGTTAVSWIEAVSYDFPFRFRQGIRKENVLIVQITTNAFDQLDRNRDSRVDREFMASALRWIADREPALVLVDCLFSDSTGDAADLALAAELHRMTNVLVLATSVHGPSEKPAALFATEGVAVGSVDVDRHPWNTVRLLPGVFSREEGGTSAALVAARKLGVNVPDREPRGGRWLNYPGVGRTGDPPARVATFDVVDFSQLALTNRAPPPPAIEGKRHAWVFLGDARRDLFRNPVNGSNRPGVEVHATAVLNLREGSWLRLVPVEWQLAFILAWGVGVALLHDVRRGFTTRLIVVASAVALGMISIAIHLLAGWWWWWLIPVACQTPVALFVSALPGGKVFFISYRHSDGCKDAEWLEGAIRAAGRRAFLAPGNIYAGDNIWPVLERGIRHAHVFLLVLTPASRADLAPRLHPTTEGSANTPTSIDGRPWVLREVELAQKRRLRMLVLRVGTSPLRIEDLSPEVAALHSNLSMDYSIERRDEVLQSALRLLHSGRDTPG